MALFRFHEFSRDQRIHDLSRCRRGRIEICRYPAGDILDPAKEFLEPIGQNNIALVVYLADNGFTRHRIGSNRTHLRIFLMSPDRPVKPRMTAADTLSSTINPSSFEEPHFENSVDAVYSPILPIDLE